MTRHVAPEVRWILFLLLALAISWWIWGLRRATTLFSISVREGRIARTRGNIPPRVFSEVKDIIERAGVNRADIRAVRRDGHAVLLFEGEIGSGVQQQVRNVVGQFSAKEIEDAPRR